MQTAAERRIKDTDFRRGFEWQERQAAFVDLLGPNLRSLKRYVASVVRHSTDVDDIMQQSLMKAYSHLDQYRFEGQFGTWLRSIARNEIRQLRRRRSPLQMAERASLAIPDRRESTEAICQRRETSRSVRRAIGKLSANYQSVVLLRYWVGLDAKDIAERLSISTAAVRVRLHRARRWLARDLGQGRRR